MRLPIGLTLIFCLAFGASLAQHKIQNKDSIRNRNVQRFQDFFFLWPVIKQRSTSFEFKTDRSGHTIKFKPNNSVQLGLGMYLFEIALEVTFDTPQNKNKNYLYGKSEASDLQANILGKNWGTDLFISNYQGFYEDDSAKPRRSNQPYLQRADIRTHNVGINGIYIFNQSKFSLRSSYNFAERQNKSGGSFSLAGTFNSYRVTADSAVLTKKDDPVFDNFTDFDRLHTTTFGLAPGYTYNVIVKHFFLNASLGLGPALNWVKYSSASSQVVSQNSVNAFADVRMALGYNGNRFFCGINFVNQLRNIKFQHTTFTSLSNTFKIVAGYRFREFGILKKRALDLLPF